MIRLKDLQNRVYSGKNCVRFEYELDVSKEKTVCAVFNKTSESINMWKMSIVFDRTRDKDSEVYNFMYTLPKENVTLELVAAVGLRYFQLHLKEEIQMKSDMDFLIGKIVEGVVG